MATAARLICGALAAAALSLMTPARAAADGAAVAKAMGRGVNILGYDGIWDGGENAPFRLGDLRMIQDAGFRHVRINLFAFRHMDAKFEIAPRVLDALDRVIARTIEAGLIPVLDEHDHGACQSDPQGCGPKLRAFWRQIVARYNGLYPQLVYEILNEPGGTMDFAQWNALALSVLRIIREAESERVVVVAALNDDEPQRLRALDLPRHDRNLILTVHYYKPFSFTHQGAPWSAELRNAKGAAWGSAEDRDAVRADFSAIQKWAAAQGRPLYLGEFGVYDAAEIKERAAYLSFIAREAERAGWPWAYWQFDHDFALFDHATRRFQRRVLEALIPKR